MTDWLSRDLRQSNGYSLGTNEVRTCALCISQHNTRRRAELQSLNDKKDKENQREVQSEIKPKCVKESIETLQSIGNTMRKKSHTTIVTSTYTLQDSSTSALKDDLKVDDRVQIVEEKNDTNIGKENKNVN